MSIVKFIRPCALTFISRQEVAPDTYTFSFKPNAPLAWQAGQHGLIELKSAKGKIIRRMFSLSSSPSEEIVSITTRYIGHAASDFKKSLWALKPGDKAKLRGPVGPMYVNNPKQHNVFIASGIGITPFRSVLVEATANKQDLHGTLIYENSNNTAIFKDEIEKLSTNLKHLEVKLITEPEKLTEETIRLSVSDLGSSMFYLAGSPPTIKRYKKFLSQLGVKRSQIKNDPFRGYKYES